MSELLLEYPIISVIPFVGFVVFAYLIEHFYQEKKSSPLFKVLYIILMSIYPVKFILNPTLIDASRIIYIVSVLTFYFIVCFFINRSNSKVD